MSFVNIAKDELNNCFTENGDKAYYTSGSFCLDLFALGGSLRYNKYELLKLFIKAYNENKNIATKLLFYIRDIRGGLGERTTFRLALNLLANFYPEIAKQVITYVPEYGRYDDLFAMINTPVESCVIDLIKKTLDEDVKKCSDGKNISLLSKWMPSINASSKATISLANKLVEKLGMTKEEYRKTLSFLRKGKIIENSLRLKKYTFDYEHVPGRALYKYKKAFLRNDGERYRNFLGIDIMPEVCLYLKTNTLSPYELVRDLGNNIGDKNNEAVNNAIWEAFKLEKDDSKTIVVRDGSGSMYGRYGQSAAPIEIADAFTLLYSESLTGDFKNTFITFSSRPELVTLKSETLSDKLKELKAYNDYSNTDIEKVYNLIIDTYKREDFKAEDAIDRIVIISDMEFDQGVDSKKTTYETFKNKFSELGYKMPEVVFLNVCARHVHLPVAMGETNVKLIGGSSKYILDMIVKNNANAPYEFMIECLAKYKFVDDLNLEV